MKNQSFLSKKKEDKNRMEKKKKKILEKDVIRKKKKELNSAIEGTGGSAGNLKYLVTCVQKKLHL